jgi:hypothetical protein
MLASPSTTKQSGARAGFSAVVICSGVRICNAAAGFALITDFQALADGNSLTLV